MTPNTGRKFDVGDASLHEMGVSESSRLEVRWIVPGSAPPSTDAWFARFPSTTEEREDLYLVRPRLPNLAVKIRGTQALDVKEFRGTRGVLELSPFGEGRLESWRKWSFPFGHEGPSLEEPSGWRRVSKQRKLTAFLPDKDIFVPALPAPAGILICSVELSQVAVDEALWWTLAFESTGPEDRLQDAIEATARRIGQPSVPAHLQFDLMLSGPYSEWLKKLERRRSTDRLWRQAGSRHNEA